MSFSSTHFMSYLLSAKVLFMLFMLTVYWVGAQSRACSDISFLPTSPNTKMLNAACFSAVYYRKLASESSWFI